MGGNTTLADEIISIVESVANNNPAPIECTIRKIYTNGYVDVTTESGNFNYLECIGATKTGAKGVIVFINGDPNNGKVISVDNYTKSEIQEIIQDLISGQIDLSGYVKKAEVDMDLLDNGYLKLKLDNEE